MSAPKHVQEEGEAYNRRRPSLLGGGKRFLAAVSGTFIALGIGFVGFGIANASAVATPPAPTQLTGALCVNGNTVNAQISVPTVANVQYQAQISGTYVDVNGQVSQPPGPRDYRAEDTSNGNAIIGSYVVTATYQNDPSTCVPPANTPPVANDDTATTAQDTPVTVNVLANDTDADGNTLSVASVTTPSHGTATIVGTEVKYTPTSGFSGTDTFTYKANDGTVDSNAATVTVTVTKSVTPPPACTQTASATYNGSVLHVTGVLCADGHGTTYIPVDQSKCDGTFANCVPQNEIADVKIPAGDYGAGKDFALKSLTCGYYQWDFYTGPEQTTVNSSGTKNMLAGALVETHQVCTIPPSAHPAVPTVKVEADSCVMVGSAAGKTFITVTNTADDTHAEVSYIVTVTEQGKTDATLHTGIVADGASRTLTVLGLQPGHYAVVVTGSDRTGAETTFLLTACATPPAPPTNTTHHSASPTHSGTQTAASAPSGSVYTPGSGSTGDSLAKTGGPDMLLVELGIALTVGGIITLTASRRQQGARQI